MWTRSLPAAGGTICQDDTTTPECTPPSSPSSTSASTTSTSASTTSSTTSTYSSTTSSSTTFIPNHDARINFRVTPPDGSSRSCPKCSHGTSGGSGCPPPSPTKCTECACFSSRGSPDTSPSMPCPTCQVAPCSCAMAYHHMLNQAMRRSESISPYRRERMQMAEQLRNQFAPTLRESFFVRANSEPGLSDKRLIEGTFFIVRHGHSQANETSPLLKTVADHSIDLTDQGREQALEAGRLILKHLRRLHEGSPHSSFQRPEIQIWASPFKRCRATAETILSVLNDPAENLHFVDGFFQSTLLVEQNFGLFEGLSKAEIEETYPKEYAFFTKCISHGGRFYARMPLGESRADVTQRVHQFLRIELGLGIVTPSFPTIPTVHIIVSHGVTVRCMAMLLTGETPEWCEIEPNPRNCSVRLITDGADHKYLS